MNGILTPVPQESAALRFSASSDGPRFMFGPVADDISVIHTAVSTTHRSSRLAVTTRPAVPQYVQSLPAPSATVTSLSSQPLRTNSLPLPTASGTHSLSGSPQPTMLVLSVTSASVLSSAPVMSVNSTGSAQFATPSSVTSSLSTITSAPSSISTALSTVTALSSSSSFGVEATPIILASTTVSQSATASASASPPTTLSEDNSSSEQGHRAPFYIAIVLGTIVVIGFIAAVIAWVVRLRLHARRRRASTIVPWATPSNDDGLEEGREATYIGQPINRIGSKDISSQDAVPWEPRGDRDVGEPKRSNSYLRGSVHSSQVPDPFADRQSYPSLQSSVAYPLPIYHAHATMDSYPDADGSLDGHRSASTLGPLQVANMMPGDTSASSSPSSAVIGMDPTLSRSGEEENGTPLQNRAGSRPPFLALAGDGLRVPWSSTGEPNFAKRRAGGSGNWERLPMPGETRNPSDVVADDDSWTSSLKSNLTDAFNAVAANLPAGPALMRSRGGEDDGDILTPKPRQHSSRRSKRSSISGVDTNEQSLSRNESLSSKPWTLEERDDGTGRVHFHGRGFDGYGCDTPRMYNSSWTLDAPTSAGTSIHRMSTQDSHTPLLVSQPPQSAFLRPETYNRSGSSRRSTGRQRQPSMRSILSRASSVYSVASDASGATSTQLASAPRIPAFSRHSTIKIDVLKPVREKREDGPVEERPGKLVARSSSSGCSFSSYYYGADGTSGSGGGEMADVDEPIRQSLSRRMKPRRVA